MKQLKVIILEDSISDAELIKYHISTLEYDCDFRCASSEKTFMNLLNEFEPDVIISDYKLDGYNGIRALLHCSVAMPLTPFIIVTGILGEEIAVKVIKMGANDFILKDNLSKLPAAILMALRESEEKREKIKAKEERDLIFTMSIDMICIAGVDGYLKTINPAFERTLGYEEEELISKPIIEFIHPEDREPTLREMIKLEQGISAISFTNRVYCKNGSYTWLEWNVIPYGKMLLAIARDVTQRKMYEAEILKFNEELEQKVTERTEELVATNSILKTEMMERIQIAKKLEHKNKEVTDSINYAKRIQKAKLPSLDLIHSAFPKSFILYKPKDIVSGDFYFFHKNDTSVYIAAADCTGHGVPGALMSMIALEKLEETFVNSSNISEILQHLNVVIKASLKQKNNEESMRDGMDIALCSLDKKNLILKYSGAYRPLWIVRKGNNEIEIIESTKKSIGGFTDDDQTFECHEIQLQKGDTFYIFSDGYADTFGGTKNKKITSRRFRQLLLEIQKKTMKEQEKYLDDFLENWKAGQEQIDDVLVIGVRV